MVKNRPTCSPNGLALACEEGLGILAYAERIDPCAEAETIVRDINFLEYAFFTHDLRLLHAHRPTITISCGSQPR